MRWRRKSCDHERRIRELEAELGRIRVQLVTLQMLGWMHSAVIRRDTNSQPAARHRRVVCDTPTELVRRHR